MHNDRQVFVCGISFLLEVAETEECRSGEDESRRKTKHEDASSSQSTIPQITSPSPVRNTGAVVPICRLLRIQILVVVLVCRN